MCVELTTSERRADDTWYIQEWEFNIMARLYPTFMTHGTIEYRLYSTCTSSIVRNATK